MLQIKEMYSEMDELIAEVEDAEEVADINEQYKPYDINLKAFLDMQDIESFVAKYDEIIQDGEAPLVCYNLETAQELQDYLEKNEVPLDDLKIETTRVSLETLKYIVYEVAEDDEY